MSSHRARQACASCTRRKVKCSKTVPCSNCLRRGEQDSCAPDSDYPVTPRSTRPPTARRESLASSSQPEECQELGILRHRVAELEAELERGDLRSQAPSSPADARRRDHLAAAPPTPARAQHPNSLQPAPPQAVPESRGPAAAPAAPAAGEGGSQGDGKEPSDAVIKDAASILEFLAWGRRKDPDYHTVVSPEASVGAANGLGELGDANPTTTSFPDSFDEVSQLTLLQLLLPSRRQVWQLVDYHESCLLWYHCSYYAPTFGAQVEGFFAKYGGSIETPGVNLQWVALLFAVLTGSITCAPSRVAQSWGFRDAEREILSKRWFQAVINCLNKAEYTANLSVLSAQAIATLTISAHLLGFSNMQSIQLAAAVRIAQSLGLHRLTRDSPASVVEKETGRRLWSQLCSQDWFGVPFSESYLVNPLYSQSEPPANCHDHDMVALPPNTPTITSYCRFLNAIASIMPQLQDGLMSCNTAFTRYEQVLAGDKRLRALATSERPVFLTHVPIDPGWPKWVPWARRSLAISSAHKIIMIHRSFLSESFSNPAFAFTRRTCLAASKTIIKEFKCVVEEDGPIIWTHQAFPVAASIILILDVLHRDPSEREYIEHHQLAQDTAEILCKCRNSMIAKRGSRLLSSLLKEVQRFQPDSSGGRKRRAEAGGVNRPDDVRPAKRPRGLDVPAFVKGFCEGLGGSPFTPPREATCSGDNPVGKSSSKSHLSVAEGASLPGQDVEGGTPVNLDSTRQVAETSQDGFFYPPPGLEGATTFENLLYLANHDFSII